MTEVYPFQNLDLEQALISLNMFYQTEPEDMFNLMKPDCKLYLNSLPKQWHRPIIVENKVYGFISGTENKVSIYFWGGLSNSWNIVDIARALYTFRSSFIGINSLVSNTLYRIYATLHYELQNVLLLNPHITTIEVLGHSYGTSIGQLYLVILQKLILFHKGTISQAGSDSINSLYNNYLPALETRFKTGSDPINKQLAAMAIQHNTDFADSMLAIDKSLFSRLELGRSYFIGPPPLMLEDICDDPDLGIRKSLSDIENGTPDPNDFFNKILCFCMRDDPIPFIYDPRTIDGKIVQLLFHRDSQRLIIGNIVSLPPGPSIQHLIPVYLNAIFIAWKANKTLEVYTYRTLPLYQLLPIIIYLTFVKDLAFKYYPYLWFFAILLISVIVLVFIEPVRFFIVSTIPNWLGLR